MVGDKQKITIITNADFPYGKSGENFTRNIAMGLKANKVDVEVVKYRGQMFNYENDTNIKSSNYLFSKRPSNALLKALQIVLNSLYTPLFIFYRKLFKKDKVFVIFALKYAYELLPFLFWCKLLNIKLYQVIADYYTAEKIVPAWWKRPKYFFYTFQRKYLDRFFNGLIVLSHSLYNHSIDNGVKKRKLLLLPHFIDFITRNKPSTQKGKRIICYCGAVSKANGIIDLINAFNILKQEETNIQLRIVGEKSADIESYLKKFDINLSDVIFTGFMTKNEVEEELYDSTVLVNPRQTSEWAQAGFPTKIGEYFATGKPTVSSAVGDLKKYFVHKQELVFSEPNNPESLADAIQFVLDNEEEAKKIGSQGQVWAKQNLDYIANSKKMLDFINIS